jgi:hypothetical protein
MNRQRRSNVSILGWFLGYQKGWLRLDVMAGLTAAAKYLALPVTARGI